MRYFFPRLDENNKYLGIFDKFLKNLFIKFRKIHYFSIFRKNLTNHALIFRAFGRKTQVVEKF